MKVTLEQVWSGLNVLVTVGRDGAMAWALRRQALFSYQTSHPFARTMNTLCTEFRMNPWTAIHAAIGLESRLDFLSELGIFPTMLTWSTFAPG